MIKIAVCDDEKKQLEQLSEYMNKYQEERGIEFEITLFQSGEELIQMYQSDEAAFNVIFLDIYLDLDKTNGMDIAKVIREVDKEVIILFLTNLRDCVFDSFKVKPFRYLLKPLEYDRFAGEFDAVYRELQSNPETLCLETSEKMVTLPLRNIIYFETVKRKIRVVTINEELEFYGSLSYYSDMLSNRGFSRIHRAFVVNLLHIKEVHSNRIDITTGETIYFNERNRNKIKKELLMFYSNKEK